MDGEQLTDQELRDALTDFGCTPGPILDSTRSLYVKKLKRLQDGETWKSLESSGAGGDPDASDDEADTPVQRPQSAIPRPKSQRAPPSPQRAAPSSTPPREAAAGAGGDPAGVRRRPTTAMTARRLKGVPEKVTMESSGSGICRRLLLLLAQVALFAILCMTVYFVYGWFFDSSSRRGIGGS